MNRIGIFLFFFILIVVCQAQDQQLSQYYNAPLYLNPAFAGTAKFIRAGLNYRMQWPAIGEPYRSFSAWGDYLVAESNIAFGLIVKRDVQGITKLASTDIGLLYAHKFRVDRYWIIKPGIQTSFVSRNVDFSRSIFPDQLNNNGNTGTNTNDPLAYSGSTFSYLDFSGGALAYNKNIWTGISFHHINRPNQALSNNIKSSLPVKWSFHAGYKLTKQKPTNRYTTHHLPLSLTPTFNYKMQGKFDQLDIGIYVIYDPLMFGVWYRGLPVKYYRIGIPNHESVILFFGIRHANISFGYSYDFTVSKLSGYTKGAHELSLIYHFRDIKRFFEEEDDIPCPDLDIRYQKLHER